MSHDSSQIYSAGNSRPHCHSGNCVLSLLATRFWNTHFVHLIHATRRCCVKHTKTVTLLISSREEHKLHEKEFSGESQTPCQMAATKVASDLCVSVWMSPEALLTREEKYHFTVSPLVPFLAIWYLCSRIRWNRRVSQSRVNRITQQQSSGPPQCTPLLLLYPASPFPWLRHK